MFLPEGKFQYQHPCLMYWQKMNLKVIVQFQDQIRYIL